jgi:hypothetical protein
VSAYQTIGVPEAEQHPPAQAQATSKTSRNTPPAARGAAAAAGTWAGASLAQKLHEKLYPSLDEPSRGRLAPVRSVVRDCYAIVGGGGGELGV